MGIEVGIANTASSTCASGAATVSHAPGRNRLIEVVYRQTAPRLLRFLKSLVRSQSDAEDLLHETYARFCAVEDVTGIERPDSFLMSVARNLAIDHLRRSKKSPIDGRYDLVDVNACDEMSSAEQAMIAKQELVCVAAAIEGLSRRRRQVFTLRRLEHLSFKEIASELDISVSTAEKHMACAVSVCTAHMAMADASARDGGDVPVARRVRRTAGARPDGDRFGPARRRSPLPVATAL